MARLGKQRHSGAALTRHATAELSALSRTHLLLGNVQRYCEIQVELGEVSRALMRGGVRVWGCVNCVLTQRTCYAVLLGGGGGGLMRKTWDG